jgi:hypothetical protein
MYWFRRPADAAGLEALDTGVRGDLRTETVELETMPELVLAPDVDLVQPLIAFMFAKPVDRIALYIVRSSPLATGLAVAPALHLEVHAGLPCKGDVRAQIVIQQTAFDDAGQVLQFSGPLMMGAELWGRADAAAPGEIAVKLRMVIDRGAACCEPTVQVFPPLSDLEP